MIVDNLELLKKLDLDAWKDIIFPIKNCLVEVPKNPLEQGIYEALVQTGAQRAIEVKGWVFEIEGKVGINDVYPPVAGYIADIYKIGEGYDGDHFNLRHKYLLNESIADSPAEALLAAYIEAIQSPLPANHRQIEDRLEWNASHYLPGDEPDDT